MVTITRNTETLDYPLYSRYHRVGGPSFQLYKVTSQHWSNILVNLKDPYVFPYPEGPCTQDLGTWDLGNSSYSTGFECVYDC